MKNMIDPSPYQFLCEPRGLKIESFPIKIKNQQYRILARFHCTISRSTLYELKANTITHSFNSKDDLESLQDNSDFIESKIGLFEVENEYLVCRFNQKSEMIYRNNSIYTLFGSFKKIEKNLFLFFIDVCVDGSKSDPKVAQSILTKMNILELM